LAKTQLFLDICNPFAGAERVLLQSASCGFTSFYQQAHMVSKGILATGAKRTLGSVSVHAKYVSR
jgi:hypothetical protein